jgi:acetyl esterase/lipase
LTNYKTIFLSIHGGGWIEGIKENALEMCKAFESSGFLIATMSYTLLNGYYKEYNIFRIIDEITAVLEKLKQFLINKGYDENKLELIMQGGSAGAHLSLLYSYMIKNPPIPIKFIVNIVGPVTLDPDYWLAIKPDEDPLENIEFKDIENAINNDKIVQMNGTYNNVSIDNVILVYFMNSWLGRNGSSDLEEIFSDLNTKEINKTNEKYQELLRKTSYGYPINYV